MKSARNRLHYIARIPLILFILRTILKVISGLKNYLKVAKEFH